MALTFASLSIYLVALVIGSWYYYEYLAGRSASRIQYLVITLAFALVILRAVWPFLVASYAVI